MLLQEGAMFHLLRFACFVRLRILFTSVLFKTTKTSATKVGKKLVKIRKLGVR